MKRLWFIAAALVVLVVVLAACGTETPVPTSTPVPQPTVEPTQPPATEPAKDKLKVAFVYVAPIGDMGWTWAHDQARLALEQALGDKVETAYIENVPEGPEAERVIRDFAQKDYDLILTTSFGFMDPTVTVAKEFPDTKFVHISGYKTEPNLSTVFGAMEEARYLSGLVAGKMTETNKIGYVAAFPIPEVVRGINGFTQGVREANPEAEVIVVWTNTWFDPPKEKEAADALLSQGADIIAQHQDTTEPQKAAADAGGFSIGYDSDMGKFVGDTVLTSPVWNWGPKYIEIAQSVLDGTFQSESFYGHMKDGTVDLAPYSSKVPADVTGMVDARKQEIVDGTFKVFCGPLNAADGTEVLAAGKCLSLDEQLNMDFFIEGVKGELAASKQLEQGLQGEPAPAGMAGAAKDKVKVAFVYVAPIGDMGWTWAHDQARLALEQALGDKVETAYIENVPEGPEAERVIRDFAQKDYDLILTTSFGFMDPTVTVAKEFPDTKFVHISGYKTEPNLSTVFGAMEEARYLSGLVAGKMTETNKIGYVAAFPIPEVVRGINGFTQGVREANPEAEVIVVWTNTWFDPPKEKEAADALLSQGADIIAQHQDTTEPQKAAADAGGFSIGYDSDMGKFVGDTVLTSPVWNWGPKYIEIAQSVLDGTFQSESFYGHMKDGTVDLAPYSSKVPADVTGMVDARKQEIVDGTFKVFCGPLNAADGTEVLAAGKCLSLDEQLNMDFFIEGVKGELAASKQLEQGLQGEPAPAAATGAAKDMKVAFVYVGPKGDLGWSYAHDQGRLALDKLGNVETTFSEIVAEGPDSERVIRDYAEKGYDMVFATSFGYMDSVLNVAKEYPDVKFEHATGYQTADNVAIYDGRGYEGWYLAGMTAGLTTKNNKLGYVAPFPIPEVVRNMNAFALGARSVNPDVEVTPVWINAWFDPPKEREAAQALVDEGADVIARESDSPEPDKVAEDAGVYAIGYNAISPDVAPKAVLTAPIWDWGVYYTKTVADAAQGNWKSHAYWGGMADGLLDMAPFGSMVPKDVQDKVNAAKADIISGKLLPFTGPLKDNSGVERVAAGEAMTDEQLLAFAWLVEGVKGQIPQ